MFVDVSIVQAYKTRYLLEIVNSILQIAIPFVLFFWAAYFIYVKISEQKTLERLLDALKVEENTVRKSQILYNIAVYYDSNRNLGLAIEYYKEALKLNENLPQAFYNLGAISEILSAVASQKKDFALARVLFARTIFYFKRATELAPGRYVEVEL